MLIEFVPNEFITGVVSFACNLIDFNQQFPIDADEMLSCSSNGY